MADPVNSYSQLSIEAISQKLLSVYSFSELPQCQHLPGNLHDNYRVESGGRKYLFRLYRDEWRSLDEIRFELDFLSSLKQYCDFVMAPVATQDGDTWIEFITPEGRWYGTLFPFSDGQPLRLKNTSRDDAQVLGEHVAWLHQYGKSFFNKPAQYQHHSEKASGCSRVLDLDYLLSRSVDEIIPRLSEDDGYYLEKVKARLQNGLSDLLENIPNEWPYQTCCHGDINHSNCFVYDNALKIFDFDQCGIGWRAFDIGKYFSSVSAWPNNQLLQEGFLEGYESVATLTPSERDAIPLFRSVSSIWVMAIHVYNVNILEKGYLSESFWTQRMNRLRDTVEDSDLINRNVCPSA